MRPEALELLKKSAAGMGIDLAEKETAQLVLFIMLLRKWSRKISLTAVKDEKDIVVKHILDSFLIRGHIRESWFVMDLGSGNGCPGIPVKVVRPSIRLLLLESRGKKVTFLRTAIREMGLADCQAVQQRAEDPRYQAALRGQLDAITARAVAKTSSLVKISMPYLKPSGKLILMKGTKAEEELEAAKPMMEKMKARVEKIQDLKVPETDWTRKIVTIGRK